MRPPRWLDEDDVLLKFVGKRMAFLRKEVSRLDTIHDGRWPQSDHTEELDEMGSLMMAEIYRMPPVEGELPAIKAFLHGDREPLARLLTPISVPELGYCAVNPEIARLRPETWNFIADIVRGRLNPKTGRMMGEPGRPKKSADAKRRDTPTYDAAEHVPVIQAILRGMFPDKDNNQIRDRAIILAAFNWRMETETLARHLSRPAGDRRRL
jgi:hypothetical protein